MKVIVITGSTRGIGRGLAEQFLVRGCKVVVSGRSQQAVDQVVAELMDMAGALPGGSSGNPSTTPSADPSATPATGADRLAGLACEVTDPGQLQNLWDFAARRFGRVDVWVNNAGVSSPRLHLKDAAIPDIQTVVSTNLTGLLLANRVALRGMQAQGGGQVWNMEGFGSGGQAQPGMVIYGATKRAVNYINKALQKEVRGTPVQVCTLSPGIVVTDLLVGDYDTDSPEWQRSKRIFNILGDKVETVAPFLVDGILKTNRSGAKVAWLTGGKAFLRFLTAGFNKRDLFPDA